MASVREVYNALRDLANKDERGFITPAHFNSFAPIAQSNIFNSMFSELTKVLRDVRQNVNPAQDRSRLKALKEDLNIFVKEVTISKADGSFAKPSDFSRDISMKTFGGVILDVTNSIAIDIVHDTRKVDLILRSNLSAPTKEKPIATIQDLIEVYPTSIKKIKLKYYKTPEGLNPSTGARTAALPKFGFTTSNGKQTYLASTSVDFEMPEHYVSLLVFEMAKLIGVSLRDADVFSYGREADKKTQVNG
jgi:hypothetical protein